MIIESLERIRDETTARVRKFLGGKICREFGLVIDEGHCCLLHLAFDVAKVCVAKDEDAQSHDLHVGRLKVDTKGIAKGSIGRLFARNLDCKHKQSCALVHRLRSLKYLAVLLNELMLLRQVLQVQLLMLLLVLLVEDKGVLIVFLVR